MKVNIPQTVFAEIQRHACSVYPDECCGVLIGDVPDDFGEADCELCVSEARRLPNVWDARERMRRFRIAPSGLARIEKEFRGSPRGVLGIYHSHPDVAARPSGFDLNQAWPSYGYLIISVRRGKVSDARVWTLSEDERKFAEGAMKTVPPKAALLE